MVARGGMELPTRGFSEAKINNLSRPKKTQDRVISDFGQWYLTVNYGE